MAIKIFCDFDGTITEGDNIVNLIKQFAPPSVSELTSEVLNGKISIREGVEKMFATIPSTKKQAMTDYVIDRTVIRDGFNDFIQFVNEQQIELKVVSGGLDFFVHPILAEYLPPSAILCNRTDFTGSTVKIHWDHSCDALCSHDCGMCKPSVKRKFSESNDFIIVIGDSITDLQIAKEANLIFARDFLKNKCEELSLPYIPFESFYDIRASLEKEVLV
ncbi:2-hydroxy-3-keto-5-methylthiopentenyl-1-phosphate phosphatase [Bacillus sp. AFS017336]|uniref:2-hydroxy-3-keto-5-methylthiopentenyl-1- phosphate phosphatase n=1 Tax=Bacillus sp. AFS017336 TaxID=2033489 RepID=UPI000BF0C913|nr:2-hydroxy-3-keto-5-methylthiopentenyl-1-phosphate phosphatase [Bacillus sp. AFS017336]PEK98312.1 2-hydroxy-3-keto-5-methylthiopentenyl-1-phosphate phosphatase [Bacillus sp. AFS017336]